LVFIILVVVVVFLVEIISNFVILCVDSVFVRHTDVLTIVFVFVQGPLTQQVFFAFLRVITFGFEFFPFEASFACAGGG